MLINQGVVANDGQVQADETGPAVTSQNGFGYTATAILMTLDAVAATDKSIAGIKVSNDGFVRVVDASLGLPAGAKFIGGFPVSSDGQLCVNPGALSSPRFINGIAVDSNGAVYAANLTVA